MPHKKAQSAMEYLMTYGWAILVVLIVAVAFWQMGVLKLSSPQISSMGFSVLKPHISATGLNSGGRFVSAFVNGAGSRIMITAIRVKNAETQEIICCSHSLADDGGDCSNDGVDIAGFDSDTFINDGGIFIPQGDTFKVELENCDIPTLSTGDRYEIYVELDYNKTLNRQLIQHTVGGTISGPLE